MTVEAVTTNASYDEGRYTWLDDAECVRRNIPLENMFVEAGHTLSDSDEKMCRFECPVRRQCLILSYQNGPTTQHGFYAGVSAGRRKQMTLDEALAAFDAGEL